MTTTSTSSRPPASDWCTDFDHQDPRWLADPAPIWDQLRQQCPVAHTDRYHGVYYPVRHEDVRAIAYDTEHFSSRTVVVRETKEPMAPAPPITSDPPEHSPARRLLLPAFTPNAARALAPKTRAICTKLIDRFIDAGRADAAVDYAQHIPVRVISAMLGLPEADGERFRTWIQMSLEEGITDYSKAQQALVEMTAYFHEQIAARGGQRGDDLISFLLDAELDGAPLSEAHLLGTIRLLLVAGIDTTWSGIGAGLWHLASHPEDRARLVAEPSLLDRAVEEFLRFYAPVTMAREVVKEVELGGCTYRPGEKVMLPFPAANRDPALFPAADRVVIDRAENRHAAFGLGIHRCLGSNLARMEMRVALEEWLRRIPEFRLERPEDVTWSAGTVRGPRRIPVVFP
jgi:cytochrome P450